MADPQPIFLPSKERDVIREYLETSTYHAMANDAALRALDSIDSLQRTLAKICNHVETQSDKGEEINGDQIMNWIMKPYTQIPKVKL